MTDAQIDAVFARAKAELEAKTGVHVGSWHMDGARWDADLEAGTITFTNQRNWKCRGSICSPHARSRRARRKRGN
ncbi:MAG: hypothetical protein K2P79_08495 [Sphingomonas sp.]|nr:hypothetical protein [Sphingomonas sp.]